MTKPWMDHTTPRVRSIRWQLAFLAFACLVVGTLASEWLGQDANSDLQYYHLYDGWAFLTGRFKRDLLPAGMQSYFNPLLDALYAWLALGPLRHLPRVLAGVMGLWFSAVLFVAALLAATLYRGWLQRGIATVLATTGAGLVTQIGTTFNEVQVASFTLGGLLVLLRGGGRLASAAFCGVLFGVAAGLKLTSVTYAPAACLAAASLQQSPARALQAAAACSGGWLLGFAAVDGWWALLLWHRFGSPVFPMFNGVFRSPWYPPANFVDDRFLPDGVLGGVLYPFKWLTGSGTLISEVALHDPRGATVLGLGFLVAVAALLRSRSRLPPAARALLVFLGAGYVAWVCTSGILRYAVVLEVSAGLVIPLLLAKLLRPSLLLPALPVMAALILGFTSYGSWGRVPYGDVTLHADVGWVRPGMLIIPTLRRTLANMVPLMPYQDSISVVGLDIATMDARGWQLQAETARRVREHHGPIAVLTAGESGIPEYELGEIGLDPMLSHCQPVGSTFIPRGMPNGPMVCNARPAALPVLPSLFWTQAAQRYRVLYQPQDAGLTVFGQTYLQSAGTAALGTHIRDWTGLLWNGVGRAKDLLPDHPDPSTLYILDAAAATIMAKRIDPTRDALGVVDGIRVLAPGWRICSACTAPIGTLP